MEEPRYEYTKPRSKFGKRCNFSNYDSIDVNMLSEAAAQAEHFKRIDPITEGTQLSKLYGLHTNNTATATYEEDGMHHVEGGWPKDINPHDQEQTVRYRRKIEKDELFVHTMQHLMPPMEHTILQNNASDIYEHYFTDSAPASLVQRRSCRTVNVYRDLVPIKRPVTHLSWSPDQGVRLAVSYCHTDFERPINCSPVSYIWDVESPNNPFVTLRPLCPALATEYNPKDGNSLVSGLMSGQVALWDVRRGALPIERTPLETSHRDPCNKVLWINAKTGTELFSASKDGQIKWWDTRKMKSPTETLVMDLVKPEEQDVARATGISSLHFEPTMGSRFLCGLENGIVVSGNRKGKTPGEQMAVRFRAQHGPVVAIERNPTFVKNFFTVGDWTVRIWSDECRESCIAWTPGHRDAPTGGSWSATRYSVFYVSKADGSLDAWDFLVQQDSPILSVKVCDDPLTYVRSHEHGQLIAVASKNGTTYMLEFSEAFVANQRSDKFLFTALLDRETRREKVIEAKNREIRLKMKAVRPSDAATAGGAESDQARADLRNCNPKLDPLVEQYEQDYETAVHEEITRRMSLENSEVNNNEPQNATWTGNREI
ncbi:dynein intermediate chain 3, ciliary [Orussus abietinus]|uniref:dynein intermediate chain 3, ciliary n=1 Tax=Orussus abietinus TaxID=222816 RepID=UPI0006250003|nr:dynein intermediate chain 3, ciliary [Orussus abietinus]